MAAAHVVHVHQGLTKDALEHFGFSTAARELAATANAQVDDDEGSQGNFADQTRRHAMRGYILTDLGLMMQTEDQAREAVDAFLQEKKTLIRELVLSGKRREAVQEIGRALHTVQDRAYHRFEPWPYDGILDAFFNAQRGGQFGLAPNYMLAHTIRDLSYVSSVDFSASYTSDTGFAGFFRFGLRVPLLPNVSLLPEASIGYDREFGGLAGGAGLSIRFGAPPPKPPAEPPERRFSTVPTRPPLGLLETQCIQADLCEAGAQGETSRAAGLADSETFVQEVKTSVESAAEGRRLWSELLTQPLN